MRTSLAQVEALRTVRLALVSALAVVDDVIYREQGSAYGTALTLYGMLKKVAHRHAEIHAKLAPVEEFFSYRHRKVRTERAKQQAEKDASHEAAPAVPGS
jgi:predicted metal-dependent phosphoesterase TrpH